jgi:hypothetical protein
MSLGPGKRVEVGDQTIRNEESDSRERFLLPATRYSISPDGRWVIAATPGSGDEEHITLGTTKAFAVDGTATVPLCTRYCLVSWDTSGGFVYFRFPQVKEGSYALPAMRDSGLPSIPPAIPGIEDITNLKAISAIPWEVESAVNPSVYAYTRLNTRRNLYRISLGD